MNDLQELKRKVSELVGENRTEEAFRVLLETEIPIRKNEITILEGRFNRLRQDIRMDVISSGDANREMNRINAALIEVAGKLDQPAGQVIWNRYRIPLLVLGVLGIASAVYLANPKGTAGNGSGQGEEPVAIDTPKLEIAMIPLKFRIKDYTAEHDFRKDMTISEFKSSAWEICEEAVDGGVGMEDWIPGEKARSAYQLAWKDGNNLRVYNNGDVFLARNLSQAGLDPNTTVHFFPDPTGNTRYKIRFVTEEHSCPFLRAGERAPEGFHYVDRRRSSSGDALKWYIQQDDSTGSWIIENVKISRERSGQFVLTYDPNAEFVWEELRVEHLRTPLDATVLQRWNLTPSETHRDYFALTPFRTGDDGYRACAVPSTMYECEEYGASTVRMGSCRDDQPIEQMLEFIFVSN